MNMYVSVPTMTDKEIDTEVRVLQRRFLVESIAGAKRARMQRRLDDLKKEARERAHREHLLKGLRVVPAAVWRAKRDIRTVGVRCPCMTAHPTNCETCRGACSCHWLQAGDKS